MSSAISGAAKQLYAAATTNAKVADLQNDTFDPTARSANKGLTADYGIYVADTDNWCVRRASVSVQN